MDFETLSAAIVAAFVLERLVDALVKPIWEHFELDNFWLLYIAWAIGSLGAYATGLNALPVFAAVPWVGRLLTCFVVGLGSSFIYDMVDNKPSLPEA